VLCLGVASERTAIVLAVGTVLGDVIEVAILYCVLRRSDGPLDRSAWRERVSVLGGGSALLLVSQFAFVIAPAVDIAFVSGLGVGTVAVYAICTRLFETTKAVVLLPQARALNRVDQVAGGRTIRTKLRTMLMSALVGAVGLIVVGTALLFSVYQPGEFDLADARRAVPVLVAMAAALIPTAVTYVAPRWLVQLGARGITGGTTVALLASNVVFDWLLVRIWGATGVAAASALSLALIGAVQLRYLRRLLRDGTNHAPSIGVP